jgi:hypothetical protein
LEAAGLLKKAGMSGSELEKFAEFFYTVDGKTSVEVFKEIQKPSGKRLDGSELDKVMKVYESFDMAEERKDPRASEDRTDDRVFENFLPFFDEIDKEDARVAGQLFSKVLSKRKDPPSSGDRSPDRDKRRRD